jgi:hypothetical protein
MSSCENFMVVGVCEETDVDEDRRAQGRCMQLPVL